MVYHFDPYLYQNLPKECNFSMYITISAGFFRGILWDDTVNFFSCFQRSKLSQFITCNANILRFQKLKLLTLSMSILVQYQIKSNGFKKLDMKCN